MFCFVFLHCLCDLYLKSNTRRNMSTAVFLCSVFLYLALCRSFFSLHYCEVTHQPVVGSISYLTSILFCILFFHASTNLLFSLCWKLQQHRAPGMLMNKLNNAYTFFTWHIVGVQETKTVFSLPFKYAKTIFYLIQTKNCIDNFSTLNITLINFNVTLYFLNCERLLKIFHIKLNICLAIEIWIPRMSKRAYNFLKMF